MKYKGFLFDLNGTMVNDVLYHVNAWYRILNELGAGISYERAKQECYGKNQELLERVLPKRFTPEEKDLISQEKEKQYRDEFKPHLKLIPGLHNFLAQWHARGIKMGIGSAAIRSNVDFVLDGTCIRKYFDAIVSADDVSHSKPDPETFMKCAQLLDIPSRECLVFEDAPKGAESAELAKMDCIILTTLHKQDEFHRLHNIKQFIPDYSNLVLS